MPVDVHSDEFKEPRASAVAPHNYGESLWLIGLHDATFNPATIEHLSSNWNVVRYSDLLRAREALLMGARPTALIIQNIDLSELQRDFIQRLKKLVQNTLILISNDSTETVKAMALGIDHILQIEPLTQNRAGHADFMHVSIDKQLLYLLRPYEKVQPNQSEVARLASEPRPDLAVPVQPKVAAPAEPKLEAPAQPQVVAPVELQVAKPAQTEVAALAQPAASPPPAPKELVLQWLEKHPNRDKAGILMLGKLHFRSADASLADVPRPMRIALLKQKLRAQDDILADEQGRFWALLAVTDEMIAIRVALRLCLAMTRSSDPNHYAVGVGLAGAYINNSAEDAHRICEVTLPAFETNGQVAVAVDRWRFSLPMSVAQALL